MAKNSRDVYFRGKAHFFKLMNNGDPKYECWSTGLYLDEPSYNLFLELKKGGENQKGIQNDVTITEEGHRVNLRRPWFKKYQGKDIHFTPPVVIGNDGVPWPPEKMIGNGSDITVKCEYYTFKPPFQKEKGSAIRLTSARIEDHVPYEPNRDLTADEMVASKGLIENLPSKANTQQTPQYF